MSRTAIEAGLTLRQLRLLVGLADHGSATAAARASGLTQPALSQGLRGLERRLRVPLVTREGRRLALTPAGRLVVEYARRILRLVDEAEAAVGDLLGFRRGRLVLGASTTPGTYLLPRLMGAFGDRHPEAELHLRIGDTREVERWVLKGELDFGVIGETREQLGLVVTPLTRDELVVVTPRKHPLSRGPLDGERLAGQALIVREEGSSTRETLERALASRALRLRVRFELGSTEAILSAVEAGLGASVVSSLAVADRRSPRVVVRRVAGLDLSRHLAVVFHPDARPSPLAREFLDFLSRHASPERAGTPAGSLAAAWVQP